MYIQLTLSCYFMFNKSISVESVNLTNLRNEMIPKHQGQSALYFSGYLAKLTFAPFLLTFAPFLLTFAPFLHSLYPRSCCCLSLSEGSIRIVGHILLQFLNSHFQQICEQQQQIRKEIQTQHNPSQFGLGDRGRGVERGGKEVERGGEGEWSGERGEGEWGGERGGQLLPSKCDPRCRF